MSNCELCGEPMPAGEEMFMYHGHSGNCPKPPLPRAVKPTYDELETALTAARAEAEALRKALHWPECWDTAAYPTLESAAREVFECNECCYAARGAEGKK